jgi:hypothetical protein
MNVTLKLPEELCRAARHRAVDESKSLSSWVADLVARELGRAGTAAAKRRSPLAALADDLYGDRGIPVSPRRAKHARKVHFP